MPKDVTGKDLAQIASGLALAMCVPPIPGGIGSCALDSMCSGYRDMADSTAIALIVLGIAVFLAGAWIGFAPLCRMLREANAELRAMRKRIDSRQ